VRLAYVPIVVLVAVLGAATTAATGCGRIGFDPLICDDTDPTGDGGLGDDAMLPFDLGCNQTITANAMPITGRALEAVVTDHRLVVAWINAAGVMYATSWQATASGVAPVKQAVMIDTGPYTQMWTAANGNELLLAGKGPSEVTAFFLHEDLFKTAPIASLGSVGFTGRNPFTRKRGGAGFIAITSAGGAEPAVYDLPQSGGLPLVSLITELRSHGAPSIAADTDGYAVVTELADQFGPGCWYSKLRDDMRLASGPGSLESTQQADCDTSTTAAMAGPAGAAMVWMDRDPVNSYVEFRGTVRGSGTASMSGEMGTGLPLVTATSNGFAVLYRSTAGVRVFDDAGARTIAPSDALADLVTWNDAALAVWTTPAGAVQLTRLCPKPAGP
jgi:hypothetical protein